jgi:predicted DCC family thiol-disulfide oxidoreductase YuxK
MSHAETRTLRLVYDGDCPLCQGIVNGLVRMDLVALERTKAFQDYEGETAEHLWDAGIRNEIAVLDEASGSIRSGVDGLLWILRASWAGPLVALAALPPFRWLTRIGYRLVAYNRHLLAPKDPTRIRCACDADFHLGYRLGLLAIEGLFVLAAVIAFASTFSEGPLLGRPEVRNAFLGVLGLAVVVVLPALRLPRERAFDWVGHLAVAAAEAAVALLPAVVLSRWLAGAVLSSVQAASVLLAILVLGWSLAARRRAVRFLFAAPAAGGAVGAAPQPRTPHSP